MTGEPVYLNQQHGFCLIYLTGNENSAVFIRCEAERQRGGVGWLRSQDAAEQDHDQADLMEAHRGREGRTQHHNPVSGKWWLLGCSTRKRAAWLELRRVQQALARRPVTIVS